jgi:hypothetical protein
LVQYHIGTFNILVNDSDIKFLSDNVHKFIEWIVKKDDGKVIDNPDFDRMVTILSTDNDFEERMKKAAGYLRGFYILGLRTHENVEPVNPTKMPKRAGNTRNICYKYCSTPLDLTRNTFRQALENKNYKRNECWLNTIYDHYHDSLLDPNRSQRYAVTREKILNIINRTEDNIQDGLTIDDVLPFFQKYKLRLRVFDLFYKMIFKYEPESFNEHNKPLYCMTDGDHIYTLNHDLKSLQQKQDDNTDEFLVYTTPYFKTDEDKTPIKHHMIESVDDLVKIAKMIQEQDTEEDDDDKNKRNITYIVHKYDDLEQILWDLYTCGYVPQIKFQASRITHLTLKLNDNIFVIRSQQLNLSEIDGCVETNTEDTYNKMNEAMVQFETRLFRKDHKSYYSTEDINILDEYRTVANAGLLEKLPKRSELVEIDVSKAYTRAFMNIEQIPVFNEFDVWETYDDEKVKDEYLYILEVSKFNMFSIKR